jgi:hypothetical protein
MSNIKDWSTTPLENADDPPYGAPEGWAPGDVNLVVRQQMADHRTQWEDAQWFNWGHVPVRQSDYSFLVSATATEIYVTGRRLKLYDTSTIYAEVLASSASGVNTLISVSCSALSSSLSSVDVAIYQASSVGVASKSDVNKTIGATFSSTLPVPHESYKHHQAIPRVLGVIYSSDPFFGPFATQAYSSFNIKSVTSTTSSSPWRNTFTVTFARSFTSTDYAVILTPPIGTIFGPFTLLPVLVDRSKGSCVVSTVDPRTGITTSAASTGFNIAIYGSSLKD